MAKFLTSARAVDMLGRQQIAGIPTAVSELFKNAYDAYANSVRGDYFPHLGVLTIRDDGIGMSADDFTARWLTIGTDSKARDSSRPLPPVPPGHSPRRQMGEKGIGRLAIASIGAQVLVVTRSRDNIGTELDEITVALIQWSLFEVPGLTLDDVVIPIRRVRGVNEIDRSLVTGLATELQNALELLGAKVPERRRLKIHSELAALDFDPRKLLSLSGPRIDSSGGTAFIVAPVSDDFESVIETKASQDNEYVVSPFQRFLMGFSNTITQQDDPTSLTTEFILHAEEGPTDLIDPASFWRPEDFNLSDHTVSGTFDEYGTFFGSISVYGSAPVEVVEPWIESKGRKSQCGPFKIKFGYVQGEQSGSRLTAEDFAVMTARLQRLGGLYIYRDGIRVLPYGNSDTDYLEMEQRRTLNAGRYYFSYRRIFGAIEIDGLENAALQEKAGREGFRENSAYRDFTAILKNFLVQIAANFFSGRSHDSNEFRRQREQLRSRSSARSVAELEENELRKELSASIERHLAEFESGRFSSLVKSLVSDFVETSDGGSLSDSELAEEINRTVGKLNDVMASFNVRRPSDLGLTAEQERVFSQYSLARSRALEVVEAAAVKVEKFAKNRHGADLPHREEGYRMVARFGSEQRNLLLQSTLSANDAARESLATILDSARSEIQQFDTFLEYSIDRLPAPLSPAKQIRCIEEIRNESLKRKANLDDLVRLMRQVQTGSASLTDRAALQEKVLDLQEQVEGHLELLQLGQAVQIVSHEFEASIRSVRSGLQKLAPWARSTPRLAPIVQDLRASFTHLDGYLRLFTPLQRRLYRQRVSITGTQIAEFVFGVFFDRLERHAVQLDVTDTFRSWQFKGYPSTFYPVFINLVDNAISWTTSEHQKKPTVLLDADSVSLMISDNGPGVRLRDREAIFDRGFSRRRGGRGLGLSLSRDLLARDGWTLELDEAFADGARFRLQPALKDSESEI